MASKRSTIKVVRDSYSTNRVRAQLSRFRPVFHISALKLSPIRYSLMLKYIFGSFLTQFGIALNLVEHGVCHRTLHSAA
jgi:hypothetical protein